MRHKAMKYKMPFKTQEELMADGTTQPGLALAMEREAPPPPGERQRVARAMDAPRTAQGQAAWPAEVLPKPLGFPSGLRWPPMPWHAGAVPP